MARLFFQHLRPGASRVSPLETALHSALRDALPPDLASVFDAQIADLNLVQWEVEDRAVNYYRIQRLRLSAERNALFPTDWQERVLGEGTMRFADGQTAPVTAWVIDRRFFSLDFGKSLAGRRQETPTVHFRPHSPG